MARPHRSATDLPARRDPPPVRVLVIEGQPETGALLLKLLGQHAHCSLCTTGDLGLARFRQGLTEQRPFDLVVLDLDLPDFQGSQVLKNLRGLEQLHGRRGLDDRSQVLVHASSLEQEALRECLCQEVDGFLLKPVQVHRILDRIERLQRGRAA